MRDKEERLAYTDANGEALLPEEQE